MPAFTERLLKMVKREGALSRTAANQGGITLEYRAPSGEILTGRHRPEEVSRRRFAAFDPAAATVTENASRIAELLTTLNVPIEARIDLWDSLLEDRSRIQPQLQALEEAARRRG